MEPLYVNIDLVSSNALLEVYQEENGWEEVDYSEINLPDVRQIQILGHGSYGTVYKCTFRGRQVAVKIANNSNDLSHSLVEAKHLHSFCHPNIVNLYALFRGESSGIVIELMEGGSLDESLSYLHSNNFIHCDIKPANMLLSKNYKTLKLCDFGTVANKNVNLCDNKGSAAWMAPEVFQGESYTHKSDIYSLGISMWEMATRKYPFDDINEPNHVTILWMVLNGGLRPPKVDKLPKPLMELIERCWSADPNDRPCSEEIEKSLEMFMKVLPNTNIVLTQFLNFDVSA
ncbi:unnamed protein product [Meloidogyne enterolobii]|uniref:Uncharacterized protein n=1 Tax=Meloidogyne enterolobii TaxID=390850 RepID=A0ACB1AHC0_MELEN